MHFLLSVCTFTRDTRAISFALLLRAKRPLDSVQPCFSQPLLHYTIIFPTATWWEAFHEHTKETFSASLNSGVPWHCEFRRRRFRIPSDGIFTRRREHRVYFTGVESEKLPLVVMHLDRVLSCKIGRSGKSVQTRCWSLVQLYAVRLPLSWY